MSDTISPTAGGDSRPAGKALTGHTGSGTAPETRGRTSIADSVVEKIAGMATREVPGIHSLGSGMARTLGAVTDKVPGGKPSVSRGVKVEVGERQAAVDLDVVVEYGVAIVDIAGDVRNSVITAVERMTGLEVVEVNITVDDVHLPDEEDEEEGESRVQ
ncbi:Asp23/Gls24 family envelope stress response protein [Streptomyces sp. H27-H5]|uniref:Asp23/Gls24 family envelope stress response protein n=1 Tax=Streptomyces sp. H27-H5 TaxID=2996460 RepID=UPI002270D24A|nr:Asp23/Gls24 family envelope stress response protein [Streptomyces sp. H27-H5]MCY0962432.1 Asp23/Gls24 family envelope stress response protein [Streptomyces sp. H27-H5]